MSRAVSVRRAPARQILRLSHVDWKVYLRLRHAFDIHRGVRMTYDRGELEIMSPLLKHDDDAAILERFVVVLTEELGLPIKHGGSTTLKRRKRQKGIEADRCYWIANAARMAGKRELDLRTDPPPDLAIEVDVTHSSLDRMSIYAALNVPEVWRVEGDLITFDFLDADGVYRSLDRSRWFPILAPADLLRFLALARRAGDENVVVQQFRDWVRQQIGTPPPAP